MSPRGLYAKRFARKKPSTFLEALRSINRATVIRVLVLILILVFVIVLYELIIKRVHEPETLSFDQQNSTEDQKVTLLGWSTTVADDTAVGLKESVTEYNSNGKKEFTKLWYI